MAMGDLVELPRGPRRDAQPSTGAAVLRWYGHKWYRCPDHCSGCFICNGGLGVCDTCGGAESCLPTDCPGYTIPSDLYEAISSKRIDFNAKRGGWICLPSGEPLLSSAGVDNLA